MRDLLISLLVVAGALTAARADDPPPEYYPWFPTPTPLSTDHKDLVGEAVERHNALNPTAPLTWNPTASTVNGVELWGFEAGWYPGQTSIDGSQVAVATVQGLESGAFAMMGNVMLHEVAHTAFITSNADFWSWANDIDACNGDTSCIRNKQRAQACAEADGSAVGAKAACDAAMKMCETDELGNQTDPECEEPTEQEKKDLTAGANAQNDQCEQITSPAPQGTAPLVPIPNAQETGGFSWVPNPVGACPPGGIQFPNGVEPPVMTPCPGPCPPED